MSKYSFFFWKKQLYFSWENPYTLLAKRGIFISHGLCENISSLSEQKLLINSPAQTETNAPVWKGFIDFALPMVDGESLELPLPQNARQHRHLVVSLLSCTPSVRLYALSARSFAALSLPIIQTAAMMLPSRNMQSQQTD